LYCFVWDVVLDLEDKIKNGSTFVAIDIKYFGWKLKPENVVLGSDVDGDIQ